MSALPPQRPGGPVDEPSNRLPWLALGLGLLVILIALGVFFYNLSQANRPAVAAATSTPTRTPTTTATSVPTLTLAPTQTAAPSATAAPTVTPAPPSPTAQPQRTPTPAPVAAPQPAATPAPEVAPQPTVPAAKPQPTQGPPTQAPAQATLAPAQPTPASTQVTPTVPVPPQIAQPGGLGNVRSDFDATYGAPTGETPGTRLVVYRRDTTEFRVQFAATDPPRASAIVQVPPQPASLQLNAAQAEARRLLPRDAQPRGSQQEGNQEFVVERFTSAMLARALPAELFQQAGGEPGEVVVVYVRDPQGAITRVAVGVGDDADRVRMLAQSS